MSEKLSGYGVRKVASVGGRLFGAGMVGFTHSAPAIVEHNPNFGQLPGGERGQNGPMAAGWQTGTEQVVGNTRDKGHHVQARADLVTQRNEAQVINQIEPERHQRIKLIDDGNTGGRYHRVELPLSQGTEIPRVDDELLNARAEARFSRYTEREMMDRAGGMVGGLADVWSSHLPHNSELLDMVDALDYGYVNGDNAADWFGGVAQELVGSVDTMIGKANLNPQQLGQLAKLENISALPPEFGLQGLRDQLTKAEFQQVKAQIELVNARLEQGVTDIGQLVEKTAQRLPDGAGAIAAFSLINIAIAAAEYKRSGSARNATLFLFTGHLLLLSACGGVVTPEPGVTIVEPTQAAQSTEVQGGGDVVQPTVAPTEAAQPEAVASATPVVAAGATRTPEYQYPTNSWGLDNGEMFYDQEALGRIAAVPEAQQEFIQNEITPLLSSIDGIPAPSQDYTFFVNTTEDELLSWGIIFGTPQKYYIPKVRELNGNEGYDVSPWRASGDVTLLSYTEVVPPTHMGAVTQQVKALGVDNALIGLNANGEQVTWFDFASGEWKFTNQFLPNGADGYSFDNDRNTWVAVVGETTFEYRGGDWVEVEKEVVVPQWNFEENGKLPSMTQENASIEVVDGNVELTFRVNNERSQLNGQEFGLTIPEYKGVNGDGKFFTLTGDVVEATLLIDPLRESAPSGLEFVPGIKMVDTEGTILAQFDTEAGIWRSTYETIEEGLGQQEVQPWMPQELGFLDINENNTMAVVGRPNRILHWNLFAPNNTFAKQVTVVELDMGDKIPDVYLPIFEDMSTHTDWTFGVGSEFGVDVTQAPWTLLGKGDTLPKKPVAETYQLFLQSPRVFMDWHILDGGMVSGAQRVSDWYFREEWAVDGPNETWREFAFRNSVNLTKFQQLADEIVQNGSSEVKGVVVGAQDIGVFIDQPVELK